MAVASSFSDVVACIAPAGLFSPLIDDGPEVQSVSLLLATEVDSAVFGKGFTEHP